MIPRFIDIGKYNRDNKFYVITVLHHINCYLYVFTYSSSNAVISNYSIYIPFTSVKSLQISHTHTHTPCKELTYK